MIRAAALAAVLVAGAAQAEERVLIKAAGGVLSRAGDGYTHDAEVFGYPTLRPAVGGGFEAGVRLAGRLWLFGAWSRYDATAHKRLGTLSLTNDRFLAEAGLTVGRATWRLAGSVTLDARARLLAGVGMDHLTEDLDGASRDAGGLYGRAGAEVSLYLGPVGLTLGYAYSASAASLSDRLGGSVSGGGHELTEGLALRF